jgi:hypothetical protein
MDPMTANFSDEKAFCNLYSGDLTHGVIASRKSNKQIEGTNMLRKIVLLSIFVAGFGVWADPQDGPTAPPTPPGYGQGYVMHPPNSCQNQCCDNGCTSEDVLPQFNATVYYLCDFYDPGVRCVTRRKCYADGCVTQIPYPMYPQYYREDFFAYWRQYFWVNPGDVVTQPQVAVPYYNYYTPRVVPGYGRRRGW